MTEQQNNSPNKQPDQQPPQIEGDKAINDVGNNSNTDSSTNKEHTPQAEINDRVEPTYNYTITRGKNEAATANNLTRWNIGISIALFLITLAAFWQTKRSVDVADTAMKNQQAKDTADTRRANENFSLQQQSLQTQIDAINESREQFKKANTPLVEFGFLEILTLKPDSNFIIKTSVKNMNNFAIQLLEVKSIFQIGNKIYTAQTKSNKYVLNSKPYEGIIVTTIIPTAQMVDSIIYRHTPIYVSGYIIYMDVPTTKKRINRYKIKAYKEYTGLQTSEFVYSKNEDFIK